MISHLVQEHVAADAVRHLGRVRNLRKVMNTEVTTVDISDLHPAHVMAALYNAAADSTKMGLLGPIFMDADTAAAVWEERQRGIYTGQPGSLDYVYRRKLAVTIDGDQLDPKWYDEHHGAGAAALAIDQLRREGLDSFAPVAYLLQQGKLGRPVKVIPSKTSFYEVKPATGSQDVLVAVKWIGPRGYGVVCVENVETWEELWHGHNEGQYLLTFHHVSVEEAAAADLL